jgi:DNA invertase Pin-like site-specific DNA recombinase
MSIEVPAFDHTPQSAKPTDLPLPRPGRKARRAKADRGLPPDEDLANLARAYLDRQRKHWPGMEQAGLLPEPTEDVVLPMVEDFKDRHRTGRVDGDQVRRYARFCRNFGGNYNRFSCDNSNPLSALDQMVNALDKARADDRFIPWVYVFCDYSVTGLDPSRQGYTSYKAVLASEEHRIETTYIDDFTRASRDELEWWKLAHLSKRLRKRMIGASDGFDVNSPDWDVKITLYGLVSRLFIKGLREKVRRGMKGAARRGTCLGKLGLGFTRQICRDAHGEVVRRPDGRPRHQPCIDPATQPYRRMMFELYVHRKWSPYKIAKHFNQLRVDGSNGWTGSSIKKLLAGLDAIGIFVWNRRRREYDHDQEKFVTIENPRSEWEIYKDPSLAIVPKELWRAAWQKLRKTWKAHPLTGKTPSRNQKSATTLFSGTLFCEYCGTELRLNRSTDKYKVMSCLSGSTGVHDCPLTSSKSTRIIEDCLLGYLRDHLLTDEVIEDLVRRANEFLEQEARKPQMDTTSMKAKVRDYTARIQKLVAKVEKEPDEALCDGYHTRIKELQKEVNDLKAAIREAEFRSQPPPAPLDLERAKTYLADLRGLLNQEIPMAAEAIRTLTGPIMIRQEEVPGRPGARWIATFNPDLTRLLRQVAKDRGYPEQPTMTVIPARSERVEVVIDKVPKYEQLAPLFKQLRDNGASVESISHAHGLSWEYATQVLKFAETGERPKWGPVKRSGTGGANAQKYKDIAPKVVEMRAKQMSFKQIAAELHVGYATARRAYDYGYPDAAREAAEKGESPHRGRYFQLGPEVFAEICRLIRAGTKPAAIVDQVGCGTSTVYRVRRAIQAEASEDQAV